LNQHDVLRHIGAIDHDAVDRCIVKTARRQRRNRKIIGAVPNGG
jgi:hypothetical protein